jgi:glucosamine-6-phosphate deaminase
MQLQVYPDKQAMAQAAAGSAADLLQAALARQEQATFVAATGASQFGFLEALTSRPGIAWERTRMFHLDEYIGLSDDHPASFRRYLQERLVGRVHPGEVHWIRGEAGDPSEECRRLNALIGQAPVDVAFVGIGENGHLAFNDPPADFTAMDAYIVVELNQACRQQQLGEGWFPSLEAVPHRAISMSIRQIMRSHAIVCTVPDRRKAQAVYECFTGEISPLHPASILRQHPQAAIFLDADAAALLQKNTGVTSNM